VGLRSERLAHVREVVLLADDVPVVFAHSIVAPDDLKGAWRSIGRLGNRPLAAALFADPRVRRYALEYRRIDRRHPLHARLKDASVVLPPMLWARRSLFRLRGRPLLVTEVFLPAILALGASVSRKVSAADQDADRSRHRKLSASLTCAISSRSAHARSAMLRAIFRQR
jgi:chorismate--pyruvate lyase